MNLAQRHRQALCETAAEVGPQAPTLCPPWDVADLMAHLVLRERRPDAAAALAVPALSGYAGRVQEGLADRGLPELLALVRSGPPRWMPTSWDKLDDAVNAAEFLVHHEDIRRAQPGWQVQDLDRESAESAWVTVKRLGRFVYRSAPVGVVVVAPGFGRSLVRRPPAGARSVVVTGPPLELLLHAFGRSRVARVEVDGRPEDVAALAGTDRQM